MSTDRRLTPARPDLAALHLKGLVEAARYVEGAVFTAAEGVIPLRNAPAHDASQETQILFGESFTAYEEKDGFLWGQCGFDAYVGYARATSFRKGAKPATHRVTSVSTPLLSKPDVKSACLKMLPMNAKLSDLMDEGRFVRMKDGYVFSGHVAVLADEAKDFVDVAERFLGVPYLWGGKSHAGLDCSGLVQVALERAGISAPRDTDMMEQEMGEGLAQGAPLIRGDLVFWKGHMGVMRDASRLLHANAFTMDVTSETLSGALARIEAGTGEKPRAFKRLKRK